MLPVPDSRLFVIPHNMRRNPPFDRVGFDSDDPSAPDRHKLAGGGHRADCRSAYGELIGHVADPTQPHLCPNARWSR
jgi:hypothetical protein